MESRKTTLTLTRGLSKMVVLLLTLCALVSVESQSSIIDRTVAKVGSTAASTGQSPYDVSISSNPHAKWYYTGDGFLFSRPAIMTSGDIVFGAISGSFYCITDEGSLKWEFKASSPMYSSPTLMQNDDIVFTSI